MKVSKQALLALAAGSSALVFAAPAAAQTTAPTAQPQRPQAPARRYNLSRPEQAAIQPLITANIAAGNARQAGQTPNWAAVQALLPAAVAAARGNDAKYLVARVQLDVAVGTNNLEAQEQAVAALVTNPSTTPQELTTYRNAQAAFLNQRAEAAFNRNDFATAERIFAQLLQANPTDQRLINNLAIVRQRMGNTGAALEVVLQNIQTQEASGGRASEDLYRRARDLVYTSTDKSRAVELAARLAQNYPTNANWRDALRIYSEVRNPNPTMTLEGLRLARAAGGLQGEADYIGFAQVLDQAGLPGEAKAVLDEGIQRGAFTATRQGVAQLVARTNQRISEDRTALPPQVAEARASSNANLARAVGDALYGYGRYGEAADLYRASLTKTGADRDLINLRLGAALALAGQRAEAETALRAVGGQPSDLARLWLAWLARNGR